MDSTRTPKIHLLPAGRAQRPFFCRSRLIWLLVIGCVSCATVSSIQADVVTEQFFFTGQASNHWEDPQNWSSPVGSQVPGQFSEVFIDLGSVLVSDFGLAGRVLLGTQNPAQLNVQGADFSVIDDLVVGKFGKVDFIESFA
ncbi:MAG: hypothetical protein CMJ81_11920 [Planctomycetaceae bacterium]|nr:hypothetical protein [Planctomycetaceae bacterium]MBP62699.1 hypothetical protein [Planctomycetaceae bacterium]